VSVQPGRLRMEPYQIVPLMRALRMSRPRLLLCDDVGLGKTIEAGMIITELMARKFAHRVLVVSPAGPLLRQWKTELLERFGIRVEIVDRAKIEEIRKRSELGANPFDHIPFGLVSIDFLKQERILEQIERTSYDIIIIDEAHHCADLGGSLEYEDSLRRKLAQVLASRCDTLLLLTATPHNGNDRSFASLLELLDHSLVDGRGILRGNNYKSYTIRRLKKHIKDHITGEPKFKDRFVFPVEVKADEVKHHDFIDFQKELLKLIAPELRLAFRVRRYSDVLSFITLLKRSVSSAFACTETLRIIRDRFNNFVEEASENQARRVERINSLKHYYKKVERFGTATFEEEQDQQYLVAEDIADQLATIEKEVRKGRRKLTWGRSIMEGLDLLISLGEKAVLCDPKLDVLVDEIRKIRAKEPRTNVIVYTEYTDSQTVIFERLKHENLDEILSIVGNDPESDRTKVTKQFTAEDNLILVSTDASAEGLNLQKKCHNLIHFELPFNPNRLEQRNGRIDRYGQDRNPLIRYLYLKNSFEDRILLRLVAKYERQRSKLHFVPDTLGISCVSDASCEKLLKGIMDEDAKLFKEQAAPFVFSDPDKDSLDDPAVRELLEEVDKGFKWFEKTAKDNIWLGEGGLNAETALIGKAEEAREEGFRLSAVDLADFVCNAILLDGGKIEQNGEMINIELPPLWDHGLEDLPGYDASRRRIRLTTRVNIEEDDEGNSVGYLGRAHPLVRKALDRVRNIGFGSKGLNLQDPRATAVLGEDDTASLLFTFLGSVVTGKGKVYEKVIGVKVAKNGDVQTYLSPEKWLFLANSDKAIKSSGIWEQNFLPWGVDASETALKRAEESFSDIATNYINEKTAELQSEQENINNWFASRVREITGWETKKFQLSIFDEQTNEEMPHWQSISDPLERIASFASHKKTPWAKRAEADTILTLYHQRVKEIDELLNMDNRSITHLGVMMILPKEASHGA
jgi:ERCC4-related helicase